MIRCDLILLAISKTIQTINKNIIWVKKYLKWDLFNKYYDNNILGQAG
jgi:hypothetical protein